MCKLKSGILFKNSVFVPDDYDSHTQMLEEKGITDTIENMMLGKFVRFEITPPNNDIFSPFSKWKYNVVQDFLPDWYTEDVEKAEERAKEAIQNWVNSHIFINKYGLVIKNGCGYYLKNCTVNEVLYSGTVNKVFGGTVNKVFSGGTVNQVLDGGTVNEVFGGGTVNKVFSGTVNEVLDGGTVNKVFSGTVNKVFSGGTVNQVFGGTVNEVFGGGTVNEVLDGGTVNEVLYSGTVNKVFGGTVNKVFGGGTVNEVLDGGTVNEVLGGTVQQVLDGGTVQKVLDGGTVKYTQYATQDIKTLIMSQNSFVIDNRTKTIYQSGNWKLKMIENWEE